MTGGRGFTPLPFFHHHHGSTIIITAAIIITTMIKLHYIKNEDASIVYDYDCYNNSFDKKNAVDWILSQGYELVGES